VKRIICCLIKHRAGYAASSNRWRTPSVDGASIVRCHWHHEGEAFNDECCYTTLYTKLLVAYSFVCSFARLREDGSSPSVRTNKFKTITGYLELGSKVRN
jgi:hypothetical protein